MARTVKVNLELENSRYVRGARESARETKAVEDAVDDLGDTSRKTSKSADDLGGELSELGRDARRLDKQIDDTKTGIRELARQIAATSDEAERAQLTKKLKVDQAALRRDFNLRKLMEVEGEESAAGFGARFVARVGPILASAPIGPAGAAMGATLGAALAPVLTAAVSGAVVGGAGVGGIVGGVALAARDARVQAAGAELGAFILGDLEKRASAFTPVVLDSIDDIRAGWSDLGPDLSRIFESSRLVDPLVAGLVSGSKHLVAGIADAVDAADPVVSSFGTLLDGVGDAAGDALSTFAQDADEGASAIEDLTTATTNFIRVTAGIVHAGATVKGWVDQVDTAIDRGRHWTEDWMSSGGVLEHFGWQLDLTADGFAAGTKEAEAYRAATEGTATVADFATLKLAGMTDAQIAAADSSGTFRMKTDEVNAALGVTSEGYRNTTQSIEEFTTRLEEAFELQNQGISANLSAEQANLRLEEAIDKATAAGKANNDGISVNTEKGRANREALLGIADAANTAAERIHETTGSTELAAQATERGRTKFLEAARAMGVSKAEAQLLADKLFGIPSVNPTVTVTTKQKPIDLTTVAGRIAAIKSKSVVISVHNKITTTRTEGRNVGIGDGIGGRRWGGITEHAQWGTLREAQIASPQGPARYAWAEPATGGEAFIPKYGDPRRSMDILERAAGWYGATVQSTGAPRAMPRPAGAAGASGPLRVEVVARVDDSASTGLIREVMRGVRYEVRVQGGDVQQVLGVRR
ncbi:hypothetical protein [Micromonospora sp. NBRC 107095]|uniref:hypothetical protein n=1 Tax=Micromonospora sp. NBRC 107095 TaxID=3032209 RepID=UPI0024A37B58|nr:hypothetical protein [Micromonospora sp. NBRC 107095]GLZ62882.1 hypothetical protein Misp05_64580 [Micromonospora sp. NBRC 107095]